MPGFDRKGPMEQGSMTGRKMGRCTNFGASLKKHVDSSGAEQDKDSPEEYPEREFGKGREFGFARGRGRGCGFGGGRGIGRGHGFGFGRENRRDKQND